MLHMRRSRLDRGRLDGIDRQMERGPKLIVADRQFGFMVGYADRLPVPSPTLARAYRRADAALRDVGAKPLWAQLAWAALRVAEADIGTEQTACTKKENPCMDRCAEVLTALFGPPGQPAQGE